MPTAWTEPPPALQPGRQSDPRTPCLERGQRERREADPEISSWLQVRPVGAPCRRNSRLLMLPSEARHIPSAPPQPPFMSEPSRAETVAAPSERRRSAARPRRIRRGFRADQAPRKMRLLAQSSDPPRLSRRRQPGRSINLEVQSRSLTDSPHAIARCARSDRLLHRKGCKHGTDFRLAALARESSERVHRISKFDKKRCK